MGSSIRARLALLLVFGLCAITAGAADGDPLFQSNEPLRIKITAPLRDVARDRDAEAAYRSGSVVFTDLDGTLRELPVQVRPRGKSRRFLNFCQVPPLRLKMPKGEVGGTLFQGQNNLKLVTHCRLSNRHDAFIQKEYLAYRMLNQITDTSFRVRPLEVEYVDSARPGVSEHRFGFLVEDKRRMARRLGLKVARVERLSPQDLEPIHADLMDLFEFMIANTDFSFISPSGGAEKECCHNAVPMSLRSGAGPYLPMPYDFDVAGFVNPPYAGVDSQLPISNVRQRLYRGFCRPGDGTAQAIARMQEARSAVFEVLRTETTLDERVRRNAVAFIEGFYAILDDPKQLQRRVIGACRKV
jgi:hypothetical protein